LAFLEKPITLQKLLKAVEQGLTRRSGAAAQAPAPSVLAQLAPEPALASFGGAGASMAPSPGNGRAMTELRENQQLFDLSPPLRDARDAFEKAYFEYHLQRENGSMTRVAEKTGLERTHLYRKLRQLGVDLSRAKKGAF
jgi:DNA-binding NtrC family response regulator